MHKLGDLKKELRSFANPIKAKGLVRFFKTGKGEYGEGDRFLGVMVPETRHVAKRYIDLPLSETVKLLKSKWHEERLCALIILVYKFEGTKNDGNRKKIYELYLRSTRYINNWDLVDVTTPKIVGEYLVDKPRDVVYRLAKSKNLWEKRIAVLTTFAFIKRGQIGDSMKLAEMFIAEEHDLMHKAVGWMLREVGKKDRKTLENFLDKNASQMPRTMLRYAIERLPESERRLYLFKK